MNTLILILNAMALLNMATPIVSRETIEYVADDSVCIVGNVDFVASFHVEEAVIICRANGRISRLIVIE